MYKLVFSAIDSEGNKRWTHEMLFASESKALKWVELESDRIHCLHEIDPDYCKSSRVVVESLEKVDTGYTGDISLPLQLKILQDYRDNKKYTQARKYRYSIQYHPMAYTHTWIIRKNILGGEWEFFKPLHDRVEFDDTYKTAYAKA